MTRNRDTERSDASAGDEGMVRDENVLVDEKIARGEGRVEYVTTDDSSIVNDDASRAASGVAGKPAAPRRGMDQDSQAPIPSMSTDTSDTAPEMTDSAGSEVIGRVRQGMAVVDASGEELGTVEFVKMGDPSAATVGADEPAEPGLIGGIFGDDDEPDVPEPLRSRLLRYGFVKIDGQGLLDTDHYVTADQIASVTGETVRLTVRKEMLTDEA